MAEEPQEARPEADARRPGSGERVHRCERCGSVMEEIHCKIMCKTCGYFRDCSDP